MTKISIFGCLSNIQMLVHTMLKGTLVGTDQLGNKYYTGKPKRGMKQQRRWVTYTGDFEPSTVPSEWHGWLHHQTDVIPAATNRHRKSWIKPPLANMTATAAAYMPPSLKGQGRSAATGDYIAWQPPR